MKKQMKFKTKGMNKDLSVSAFNPEFSFENKNLRLSTSENNTLMSWVNEKGTKELEIVILVTPEYWSREGEDNVYVDPHDDSWTYHSATYSNITTLGMSILGTPIGTAVINHKLILFTTNINAENPGQSPDYIYQFTVYSNAVDTLEVKVLFNGNLHFSTSNPLETLVSYEAEDIQKVYWVDGLNQPRVINLMDKNLENGVDNSYFDFVRELALNETVTVKKMLGANGMFAPGVIQYAFTYYTKHGQESNIFYTTPLYYISHKDRGAAPDEKVSNAFRITVRHLDMRFDYLRIYSIQRTSINGTPICKRVRDIYLKDLDSTTTSYTDDGMSGDTIDPTELLYKGGESIIVETLEQKDNTLFLGNLKMKYSPFSRADRDTIKQAIDLGDDIRTIYSVKPYSSADTYQYYNQLSYFDSNLKINSTPCGGFKRGDYYRCGVQFQDITGKWSEPIWIQDYRIYNKPRQVLDSSDIELPIILGTLNNTTRLNLISKGFVKVRPVVVFPEIKDRVCICQGVLSPTIRISSDYQSSYFFRTREEPTDLVDQDKTVAPGGFDDSHGGLIPWTKDIEDTEGSLLLIDPSTYLRNVEVEGKYNEQLFVDPNICTFHSPDINFDDILYNLDYNGVRFKTVGNSVIANTLSDIDIQTESPTISHHSGGFDHKQFTGDGMHGIVSGLFYDDYSVDDNGDNFRVNPDQTSSFKWLIYPWQASGSLNNDINRPNGSTPTAVLKKKVISNLRFGNTNWNNTVLVKDFKEKPELFSSDEVSILYSGTSLYKGNIDTMFQSDVAWGKFFAFDGDCDQHYDDYDPDKNPDAEPRIGESSGGSSSYIFSYTGFGELSSINTPFTSDNWWKTWSKEEETDSYEGLYKYISQKNEWHRRNNRPGDDYIELVRKRVSVRMRYKSTPHLVVNFYSGNDYPFAWTSGNIPIIEIVRNTDTEYENSKFGGTSFDAQKENNWIPCGEPVRLDDTVNIGTAQNPVYVVQFKYSYGDTYYQRWDCLKTYAFTPEDINQIVEIGSFMLETRVNIDGRYDRNRGQINNLNMSPLNFNLMNDVYSQIDNFFTYKITGDEEDDVSEYPNQITWSKTKESGADVDLWTNLTLASILEMDGDKGEVRKLIRLNDQLLCFQDKGISLILYNENILISSTQGVPIEIANSGKVQGKRYLSNTIGCTNKWSIVSTPSGIYFIDSITKSIYLFTGELKNISQLGGMDSWCKLNIKDTIWLPTFANATNSGFASYYDQMNQDVLFINYRDCLAWNEKVGTFTSFYSYESTPYFCNLDNIGIWIKPVGDGTVGLWKHRGGYYGEFFGIGKPYWMTIIGNPEPQVDKIFTNLEFRAYTDMANPGDLDLLPFTYLETWNEYQHGFANMNIRYGHSAMKHHSSDGSANFAKKFRIWRCDIPRDNADYNFTNDAAMGIYRTGKHPMDRMRNPWLYLKLYHSEAGYRDTLRRTEIHDIVLTYFT